MGARLTRTEPLPLEAVTVDGAFWKRRLEVNRRKTLPHEHKLCMDSGRFLAWRAVWDRSVKIRPHQFWGSDAAKWIEAAAYTLAARPDPALEGQIDQLADWMARAQHRDGYLNLYYTLVEPGKRWSNLRDMHELYGAGHLMEAAVEYYHATGKRKLLDVLCRYADHIDRTFGRQNGQRRGYPGHEEIELALVKLYRATGERRYLRLAKFFIDERGRLPHYFDQEASRRGEPKDNARRARGYSYNQAHLPVREQRTAEGHSVRAMYLYSGMVDVAAEAGDRRLLAACKRLWNNVVQRRMYVTGGVGSTRVGERFSYDYDLPNGTGYAETCANIGLVFFAHRLLQIEPDATYADVMELALYNSVLSGVSLDGKRFFYDNLLTVQPKRHAFSQQKPPFRQEWFGCACCPPNIARMIASVGRYVYSQGKDALYVHLYTGGSAEFNPRGVRARLTQRTGYPWRQTIDFEFTPERPVQYGLALRIPAWCRAPRLAVNGRRVDIRSVEKKGYAVIRRVWSPADRVRLTLPMPVERIEADPRVAADCGCVALKRGPIVYCLEEVDNGPDLATISLPRSSKLRVSSDGARLCGAPVIRGRAQRRVTDGWGAELYRPIRSKRRPVTITAVPYCLWANRREGEMRVWIREA